VTSLRDSLLSSIREARISKSGLPSFHAFITSPDFCGKTLSPAMEAIVLASEGKGREIPEELSLKLFNCEPAKLPDKPRRSNFVSAGGRGGKSSFLIAPKALHAAWTVPLITPNGEPDPRFPDAHRIAPGESPLCVIIASKQELAVRAFRLIVGLVQQSPILKSALVGTPNQKSLFLRRPDGIVVEVKVGVANSGGQDVRGGTLLFVGMDEASFFKSGDYAVNDKDIYEAANPRIVPYGQIFVVSTPLVEGQGLLERYISLDWGKHEMSLVAARVPTRLLNPSFDPDFVWEKEQRAQPGGEENVQREIYGIPFERGTNMPFPLHILKKAAEKPIPQERLEEVGAGADTGHSSDRSALAISARHAGGQFSVQFVQELSAKTNVPSVVYKTFRDKLGSEGITEVAADGNYKEAFRESLHEKGIRLVEAPPGTNGKSTTYVGLKMLLEEGRISFAALDPETQSELIDQLRTITVKRNETGTLVFNAPRKRVDPDGGGGTSHADAVSALVLSLWRCGSTQPDLWKTKPNIWTGPKKGDPRRRPPAREYGGWAGRNRDDYQR
jgi:hypothetical protein